MISVYFLICCLLDVEGLVTQLILVNFVFISVMLFKSVVISKCGNINIKDCFNVISK